MPSTPNHHRYVTYVQTQVSGPIWTVAVGKLVWQHRPHDGLRDLYFPRRAISPNDKYTALVAAAGYLPLALSGEDYLELLPVAWRQINDYGVRVDYRTYDSPEHGRSQ